MLVEKKRNLTSTTQGNTRIRGYYYGDHRRFERADEERKQRAKAKRKENREGGEEWREVPKSEQARRKTKAMAARMVCMVRRVGLWSSWVGGEWAGVAADEDKVWPVHLIGCLLKVTQHRKKKGTKMPVDKHFLHQ